MVFPVINDLNSPVTIVAITQNQNYHSSMFGYEYHVKGVIKNIHSEDLL